MGNNDRGNSMPEMGKQAQAIECLADIRKLGGASSRIPVFDSEQLSDGNEQGEHHSLSPRSPEIETPGRTLQGWHGMQIVG